ncbi:MAG TPA: primosomal protein N' [Syntrophomonadaceae bacterium]|nr:primosomal protein N' [Syntrophomonadaceae bacterium]
MGEECAEVVVRVNHPRLNRIFYYRIPEGMGKPHLGTRVTVPLGPRIVEGWIIGYSEPDPEITLREIAGITDIEPDFTEELLELAHWMAGYYLHFVGEILDKISPPRKPKRSIQVSSPAVSRMQSDEIVLTVEQQAALDKIKNALSCHEFSRFLLYGVTGSGKTEVYLRAAESALAAGCQVLYLVPEIALTPQINRIFQERFGEQVAVWHHRLAGREKYRTWEGIRTGELRVLIGPRSAVFAPFAELGLIIIDEEHDQAYKQQEKPYYHARQVALWRARYNRAAIILGSATPSLESYASAAWGRMKVLSIRKRPPGRNLPVVRVIDLRQEHVEERLSFLSEYLVEQIRLRLERKEQVILFLNRRGFAPLVYCSVCGDVIKCQNCSISLIYHKQTRDLRCHYCNAVSRLPRSCPSCGSTKKLRFLGVGIQRVEKEIDNLFPEARVARLDFDTTRKKGAFQRILGGFAKREADILLGTQMVAKGHDFPGVTLVGVLNADLSLNLPDFRSAERTFQILTQVSGRAGRGATPGEVVVQTLNPDHYSIRTACLGGEQFFYREEAHRRQFLGYPPFGDLIRVRLSGKDEQEVLNYADQLAKDMEHALESDQVVVLGPAPAPVLQVKGYYRYQVMLKGNCRRVRPKIHSCLDVYRQKNSVIINVEVDPFGF